MSGVRAGLQAFCKDSFAAAEYVCSCSCCDEGLCWVLVPFVLRQYVAFDSLFIAWAPGPEAHVDNRAVRPLASHEAYLQQLAACEKCSGGPAVESRQVLKHEVLLLVL